MRCSARASIAAAFVALTLAARLDAQGGVLLQGIADAEVWKTDSNSTLLIRNAGRVGLLGRFTMWGALEPWRGVVVFAQGEIEGGPASHESGDVYADQLGLRYTRSDALVLDVGKMPQIIGTFAARRFSTRNPLIGQPDGYPLQYPVGAQLSGATKYVDYRAAVLSLPVSHDGYVPGPTASYRPAISAGVTPYVGVRLGGSATWGPYLNNAFSSRQLAGRPWQDYEERILAADAEISYGYLETRAEIAQSRYDVPRRGAIQGTTYYGEAKYTLHPRLFIAGRFERNTYPFIRPGADTTWTARSTDLHDGEVGVGFRASASTLLKASYRRDVWHVTPQNQSFVKPGGRAFAVQLSQAFDVMDWFSGY